MTHRLPLILTPHPHPHSHPPPHPHPSSATLPKLPGPPARRRATRHSSRAGAARGAAGGPRQSRRRAGRLVGRRRRNGQRPSFWEGAARARPRRDQGEIKARSRRDHGEVMARSQRTGKRRSGVRVVGVRRATLVPVSAAARRGATANAGRAGRGSLSPQQG